MPALIGIGAFFLAAAPLVRFGVAPALVKAPLDQSSESVSEGSDVTYLSIDATGPQIRTGRTVRAVREVRGDAAAGDGDRAVWDSYLTLADTDGRVISWSTDRLALDRRTSSAVACCGEAVDGRPVRHEGLSVKFPFHTEKKDLPYFDPTLGAARPARFVGTETVAGLPVYRFEQVVDPVRIRRERAVPGSLFGRTGPVDADLVHATARTMWVEPVSGVIVRGQERSRQVLRTVDGAEAVVFDGLVRFTDRTVADAARTASSAKTRIIVLEVLAPLVALVLGLLAVGAAAVAHRRRPGPRAPADPGGAGAGPATHEHRRDAAQVAAATPASNTAT